MLAKYFKQCILVALVLFFIFSPHMVFAESFVDNLSEDCSGKEDCERGDCLDKGNCEISEITKLMVGVAKFILGIIGSVVFLFFIYGGIMFILSAGSPDKVTKAKGIFAGATTGLIIVFTAYMIVQLVLTVLGAGPMIEDGLELDVDKAPKEQTQQYNEPK